MNAHSLIQLSQERLVKESDSLNSRFQKLQQDFEAQLVACDTLNNENQGKASDLKVISLTISIFNNQMIIIYVVYYWSFYPANVNSLHWAFTLLPAFTISVCIRVFSLLYTILCIRIVIPGFRPITRNVSISQQKEDEVGSLKQEVQRLNKMRDSVQRRLRIVEDQKADIDQAKEVLRNQITALEKGESDVTWTYHFDIFLFRNN